MGTPSDLNQADLYEGAQGANRYQMVPGVCILPLAETPPTTVAELEDYSPVVVARLHAPFRLRKYEFGGTKKNNPPVAPTPQDAGAFVFVGGSLTFATAVNPTFWSYDWTVAGSYMYVENCVSRPQDGFVLGSIVPLPIAADQANVQQFGSTGPTVGAVAGAGAAAVAAYNYGQTLVGLPPGSRDTVSVTCCGSAPGGTAQGSAGNIDAGGTGALIPAWSFATAVFYPGTLLNDQLANGGGV